jgi:hypothetical protein
MRRRKRRTSTPEQLELFNRMMQESEEQRRAERDAQHERWENAIRWSRCSAGTRGWFWIVLPSVADCQARGVEWYLPDPTATGFEPTLEAAESIARATAGEGAMIEPLAPARYASTILRKRAVEKRMSRDPIETGETAKLEFVWEAYYSMSDCPVDYPSKYIYTPYRVVKKTVKRVYVEREPYRENVWQGQQEPGKELEWWYFDIHTFILDRRKLESGDGARSSRYGWHRGDFYPTREAAERATASRNGTPLHFWWADILGVKLPCDRKAIKAAYRKLAKQSHPDAGGDADAFVRIDDAYRAALEWAGGAA